MKKLVFFLQLFISVITFGQVGIGTNTPDASAKLEVSSTNKGFLPPRISLTGITDVSTIISPVSGLLIYNTATTANLTPGYYYFNGNMWVRLSIVTQLDELLDAKNGGTNFTGSLLLGTRTTGTLASASENVGVGTDALKMLTSGQKIAAVGNQSLSSNTSGKYNVGLGYRSLWRNNTGGYNVAIGSEALSLNTTGTENLAVGDYSGTSVTTGMGNTLVGASANVVLGTLTNSTAIGYGAVVSGSNTIQLGNGNVTSLRTQGTVYSNGIALTSDSRLKQNIEKLDDGLSTVLQLRPYTYEKKNNLSASFYDTKEFGFLAQDIQKLLPELVYEGVDEQKILSVNYVALIPILTKAIQEQQQQIKVLTEKINGKQREKRKKKSHF